MKTEDLIARLSTDATPARRSPLPGLALALAGSIIVAGVLFFLAVGLRPDFVTALSSWRFDYKFVVTLSVAGSAFLVVRQFLFPESSDRASVWWLLAGPIALVIGIGLELYLLAPPGWQMAATGKNALVCLTVIPSLGIVPLGLFVWALRQGAPTRPVIAGVAAGILAGGIAATFYAANCTDDSPLFVATWYPLAIAILALAGAALGRLTLRW